MADYIDRKRAIFETERFFKGQEAVQNDVYSILCVLPAADVAHVVFCIKCKHHGMCLTEKIFLSEGIENPFCCRGE